jgi:hypothetical protein
MDNDDDDDDDDDDDKQSKSKSKLKSKLKKTKGEYIPSDAKKKKKEDKPVIPYERASKKKIENESVIQLKFKYTCPPNISDVINRIDHHRVTGTTLYDHYLDICYGRVDSIVKASTICKLFDTDGLLREDQTNEFLAEDHNINNNSYNINVLTYGKTLFYILRYIQFLLLNFERTDEIINFFIFCDIETYSVHMNNLQFILNALRATEYHFAPEVDASAIYNFKQFLELYQGDRFHQLSSNELRLFQSINIYYITSADPLMKGIGCKRAAINQFHYLICNSAYNSGINKDNYIIMQLDDNISGITNMNDDNCKKRTVDNIIQCSGRAFPQDVPKDLLQTCSTDNNVYRNNIMKIYKLLKDIMIDGDHNNILLCGIDKGAAITQDTIAGKPILYNTHSIYKLTMQRIHRLHSLNIFYNPFFTRFLEDLTFNAIIKGYTLAVKKINLTFMHCHYHLRFIHNEYIDNEDCFPEKVGRCYIINDSGDETPINIQAIEPIYLMYIIYLHIITDMKYLSIAYRKKDNIPTFVYNDVDYLYVSKGKYSKFHNILYLFYLSYRMDTILNLAGSDTGKGYNHILTNDPTNNTKFLSYLINTFKFIKRSHYEKPDEITINITISPNFNNDFNPDPETNDLEYSVNSFYYYAPRILSTEYDFIFNGGIINTDIYQMMESKCKTLTKKLYDNKNNILDSTLTPTYKTFNLDSFVQRKYNIFIDQDGGHNAFGNMLLNQSKKLMQLYANANYQLNAEIIKYYKHLYYRDLGLTTNIFINDNNNFIKSYIDIVHHQLI